MALPWHLDLPIAGNSVNILLVFGMGGIVGLLSGIFGVGGGFLMTPLLIMMGIPPTVAATSDSNQIVGASTAGTIAHFRMGNVDIKMGLLLLLITTATRAFRSIPGWRNCPNSKPSFQSTPDRIFWRSGWEKIAADPALSQGLGGKVRRRLPVRNR